MSSKKKKGSTKKKDKTIEKQLADVTTELQNLKKIFARMFGVSPTITPWGGGERTFVPGGPPPAQSGVELVEVIDGFQPAEDVTKFSMYDDSRINDLPEDQNPRINVPGLSFKVRGIHGDRGAQDSDSAGGALGVTELGQDEEPRYTGPPTRAGKKHKELGVKSVKMYLNQHTSPFEIKGFHYPTLVGQVAANTVFNQNVVRPFLEQNKRNGITNVRLEAIVGALVSGLDELTNGDFSKKLAELEVPGLESMMSQKIPEVTIVKTPQIQGAVDDYDDLEKDAMEEGGSNRYFLNGPNSASTKFTKIPRQEAEEEEEPIMVQGVVSLKSPVGYHSEKLLSKSNAEGTSTHPIGSSQYTPDSFGVRSPSRKSFAMKTPRKAAKAAKGAKKAMIGYSSDDDEEEEEEEDVEEEEEEEKVKERSPKRFKDAEPYISSPDGKGVAKTYQLSPEQRALELSLGSSPETFGKLVEHIPFFDLLEHQSYVEGGSDV